MDRRGWIILAIASVVVLSAIYIATKPKAPPFASNFPPVQLPSEERKGIFERAKEQAELADKLSRMRMIGLAMMIYVQDWDMHYPPETSLEEGLLPYLKDEKFKAIFSDPNFHYSSPPPYKEMKNPSEVIAVTWEVSPQADIILYADGHVKLKYKR
jgi:hypothetical protein